HPSAVGAVNTPIVVGYVCCACAVPATSARSKVSQRFIDNTFFLFPPRRWRRWQAVVVTAILHHTASSFQMREPPTCGSKGNAGPPARTSRVRPNVPRHGFFTCPRRRESGVAIRDARMHVEVACRGTQVTLRAP